MKKQKPIKCPNCKEKEVPLFEIEIGAEKKEWCEECISGYNLIQEENGDK